MNAPKTTKDNYQIASTLALLKPQRHTVRRTDETIKYSDVDGRDGSISSSSLAERAARPACLHASPDSLGLVRAHRSQLVTQSMQLQQLSQQSGARSRPANLGPIPFGPLLDDLRVETGSGKTRTQLVADRYVGAGCCSCCSREELTGR